MIAVLDVLDNCRVAAVSCSFPNGYKLLLMLVYFPCFGNSSDYECDLSECLGFIDNCAHAYDYDDIIVLGVVWSRICVSH